MGHRELNFAVSLLLNILKCVDFVLVSPQAWEAKVFEFVQEGSSQGPTEVISGQESYDAQNLRRRFFEEADRGLERDYYNNILLYGKEVR